MKNMMIRIGAVVWIASFVCFAPAALRAGEWAEDDVEEEEEWEEEPDAEEWDEEDEDEEDGEDDDVWFLGRSMRLDFALKPEDEENSRFSVLCAGGDFGYEMEYENDDSAVRVRVWGSLRRAWIEIEGDDLDDDEDADEEEDVVEERLVLTYEGGVGFDGEADRYAAEVIGSVVVEEGRVYRLGKLGEKTLVVRVVPADAPRREADAPRDGDGPEKKKPAVF